MKTAKSLEASYEAESRTVDGDAKARKSGDLKGLGFGGLEFRGLKGLGFGGLGFRGLGFRV